MYGTRNSKLSPYHQVSYNLMASIYENEQHEMIRQSVREFAQKEVAPVTAKLDETETFSTDLIKKMADIGLFGIMLPEADGGHGMDTLSFIIAIEEMAKVDASQAVTIAVHNSLGIGAFNKFGTPEQKEKYIPKLLNGEHLWAFGLTEANAGSDSRGTQTKAYLDGDEWVLNGSKIFITNGATPITLGVTVQAVTGELEGGKKEFTNIVVDAGTPGFTAEPMHGKMMWRASNTAQLYFDNVRVPKSSTLGPPGEGSRIMLGLLNGGRLSIAAMGLGCAEAAYEKALAYSKERHQFGKAISTFQAIAFKLADMATKIELGRNLLYKACWLKETGKPYAKEASMAKLYNTEMAKEVVDAAVQVHGGYGLMEEYGVARLYRDQRVLEIVEGSSEVQRMVIGRHILKG
jgi:alkylation response protein AidB-like acyl-CoA dehydrogenase